jgi:hypothetical protein
LILRRILFETAASFRGMCLTRHPWIIFSTSS